MKNVISFSLWGNNKGYLCGAIANAKIAKDLFPGWICRFYCANNVSPHVIQDLRDLGCEIVLKKPPIGFIGLFWRLEAVYDDPDIEYVLIRDTDSRLTPRDLWAVSQWIISNQPAMIIRDAEGHSIWMCGATCGFKTYYFPEFQELIHHFWEEVYDSSDNEHGFDSNRGKFYGTDQEFMSRMLWPLLKHNHIGFVATEYPQLKLMGTEFDLPPLERLPDMSKSPEPYIGMVCNLEKEYDDYVL
jgi:hypothetical protein